MPPTYYMPSTQLIGTVVVLIVLAVLGWFINTRVAGEQRIRTIVNVALGLIGVGIVLWLVNTFVPMANSIKALLNILVVLATIVIALQKVGLWAPLEGMWNNLVRSRHLGEHGGSHISP
jgi:hypothetical protein